MEVRNVLKFAIAIMIPQLAGVVGSVFTMPAIPTWYAGLNRPTFAPPNWVFGPVWTTLFLLMGIAAFLVWRYGVERREVRAALGIFCIQLILNTLWSVIFFGFQNPGAALIEIIILWLAILATIIAFACVSRPAAYLLIPYLAWVSFAIVLNYRIWILN